MQICLCMLMELFVSASFFAFSYFIYSQITFLDFYLHLSLFLYYCSLSFNFPISTSVVHIFHGSHFDIGASKACPFIAFITSFDLFSLNNCGRLPFLYFCLHSKRRFDLLFIFGFYLYYFNFIDFIFMSRIFISFSLWFSIP